MIEGVFRAYAGLGQVSARAGLLLVAALLLTGCNGEGWKALGEALATVMLVLLAVAILGAILSFIWLALQITVIVVNFTRPQPWSMVTGYVLAAMQALGSIGASLTVLSGATGAEPTPDQLVATIGGMVVGLGTTAILAGSSYWAQQKLKPKKLEDSPY